ncbi:ABC transporter substrate-binding protein [Paraburkholderia azotifigens]|uniref:ABC transporter substrate-binding protein n=1 Tax=Paraburkholderia azotifigens TaxID=2057004 RepID=UPI00317626AB
MRSLDRHSWRGLRHGAIWIAALSCVSNVVRAEDSVTFASYGGDYQKNIVKALVKPAADQAGVSLRQETHAGLASVRLQVLSKKPAWDIVQLGANECAVGSSDGLFEKIDYQTVPVDGLPANARNEYWVATNYYSVVLAYRTDKYGNNPPKSWADFWDIKRFPGRRALGDTPEEPMSIALLADGTTPNALFPLDQKRALASLRKIKPAISAWWTTGAQSAQLLKDGEADMVEIWASRIVPLINDGAPVAFTYNQALLAYSCMVIPKGAKHPQAAQRVLAKVVSVPVQANLIDVMPYYGPVNEQVFRQRSFPASTLANTNSAPANRAKQVLLDPTYWGAPGRQREASEAYRALISE